MSRMMERAVTDFPELAEILRAIRAVHSGEAIFGPAIAQHVRKYKLHDGIEKQMRWQSTPQRRLWPTLLALGVAYLIFGLLFPTSL